MGGGGGGDRKIKPLSLDKAITENLSFILLVGNIPCYSSLFTLLLFVTLTVQHYKLKCFTGYLRTSMTTERLSGLALMNIHRNKSVDYGAVVKQFAEQFPRIILIQLPRHA